MKRSPMPSRVDPLGRRTRSPLLRRTPLPVVSTRRKRQNTQRTPVVNALRVAGQGRCARCDRSGRPVFGHERRARAQGGSILRPDCVLCNGCNGWCEDKPQVAAWTGWKVSSKWPHDPALNAGEAWALDGSRVRFTELADGIGVTA